METTDTTWQCGYGKGGGVEEGPEAGVLDEPYSAKLAQLQPMYVYWRACTATQLSGFSWP